MRYWTSEEDAVLRRLLGVENYAAIGRRLGRSHKAVENRVAALHLVNTAPRLRPQRDEAKIVAAFTAWRCGNPGAQLSWRV